MTSSSACYVRLCELFLCVFCVNGLSVNVAPYGVVTVRDGTARIQTGSYELLVIMQRPAALQQRYLSPLLSQAEALLSTAQTGQVVNLDAYLTRLQRLQTPARVRRGLINAVGEITKSLFGVALDKDVQKIRNTVNELVAESNARKIAIKDIIVCVNQTITQQKQIEQKVNVLANHINQLQDDIQTLAVVHNELGVRLHNAEMLIIIENILSLAEEIYKAEQDVVNYFQYKRDLAVIGHLTESLVPKSILKAVRRKVKIDVSDDFLYANLEVRVMKFDEDSLGYWVSLPILDGEPYTLWRVLTVPFPADSRPWQIIPEVTTVGQGLQTGNFIEADLCRYDNPRLCPSPVEYSKLDCINSILAQKDEQLQNCKTVSVSQFDINIKRVTPTSVIISTNGEKVEERCYLKPPQTFYLEANTYLLSVAKGCVLEGGNWKFQATRVEKEEIEIRSSVLLLPEHFNVSVDVPVAPPLVEFNYSKVESLIANNNIRLPDFHSNSIKLVTLSGSVIGYVAFLLLCASVATIFVYRFLRKRRIAKRRKLTIQPTVVSPTEAQSPSNVQDMITTPVFKQFCETTAPKA